VGFSPEHVLAGSMNLPWKGYPSGRHQAHFVYRLEQAMAALPGDIQFSVSNDLPFSGSKGTPMSVEDQAGTSSGSARTHLHLAVTAGHWRTMGIPLIRGQLLGNEAYASKSTRVCVIDQAMADTYWPDADPVGRRLSFGTTFNPDAALTIIGVVGNVKHAHQADAQPKGMVYLHFGQFPTGWLHGLVRGPLPPAALAEMLRKVVKEIDPEMLVPRIRTMEQIIDDSLLTRRSPAVLSMIFAGIALLLSAIGTYGVLAYAVSHRRREIGVRLALGALPRQIVELFMTMGARLLLGGCALGLLGAWATGRAMRSVLFEVAPFSPVVIGGVVVLMGSVVLVAIIIPAARAARVDPCETLRHD
jgi:predicted permease